MASVASLPPSLLLLLHLYILNYPHANRPEYDHDLFNPSVRGLRDRMKTMEDITYFLLTSIIGKKDARLMFPSYPCVQPTESTAFRMSLTRYLEGLRNQYRDTKQETTNEIVTVPLLSASVWKDTLVRKSLLEECSGERFERLILCLSTHALLHRLERSPNKHLLNESDNTLLRSQPLIYASLLATCQGKRAHWKRMASLLYQRQSDLQLLREELLGADNAATPSSIYKDTSTDRIYALAQSKYRDIRRHCSTYNPDAIPALEYFLNITGLELPSSISPSESMANSIPITSRVPDSKQVDGAIPLPLPVSAAHHPSYLKKLKKPVLLPSSSTGTDAILASAPPTTAGQVARSYALNAVADTIEADDRVHRSLTAALAKAKRISIELTSQLETLKPKERDQDTVLAQINPFSHTQTAKQDITVDFETDFTPDLVRSLSLVTPAQVASELESKIDHIRTALLPSFPDIPRAVKHTTVLPSVAESRLPKRCDVSVTQPSKPRQPTQLKSRAQPPKKSIRYSLLQTPRHNAKFMKDKPRKRSDFVADIVDGVRDNSVSFDDENPPEFSVVTPSHKLPPGTPLNTIKDERTQLGTGTLRKMTAKASFAFPKFEPPSLAFDSDERSSDEGADVRLLDTEPLADSDESGADHEDMYDEGPSMTLRDILLQADTTTYELIGNEVEAPDASLEGWD